MNTTRGFKFRAWIKSQRIMKPVYSLNKDTVCLDDFDSPEIGHNVFGLDDIVVMQFTGVQDKNGKDIYEGDICQFKNDKMCFIYRVKYIEKSCVFGLVFKHSNSDDGFDYITSGAEVIGNIYENPEMLSQ